MSTTMKASITISIDNSENWSISSVGDEVFESMTDEQKWEFLHDAILELQGGRDYLEAKMLNDQTEAQGFAAAPTTR